jgi:hypothetical protein
MANEITQASVAGEVMEQVLIKGDLSKLTSEERAMYYNAVCKSVGFNPLTRPLEYITLNGKLTLYARRDAADQLRKLNGISVEIVSRSVDDGLLVVHARARDKTGRTDEDFGAVSIGGLRGEAAANAILKAVTKAKRRVTLSISGMGFLDETEVESIPGAEPARPMKDVTQQPSGGGFRMSQTKPPNEGASGKPAASDAPAGEGGATPPPSHDAIFTIASTREPSMHMPMDDGVIADAPSGSAAWLQQAIADVKLLGKGALKNWSVVNASHIDTLSDEQKAELRAALKAVKEAPEPPNPLAAG